jgi:hypothetical protein
MFLESITGIVVVIVLFNAIELARSFADNPREPRRLRPLIPLVGHILGLLRYGPTYYTYTR